MKNNEHYGKHLPEDRFQTRQYIAQKELTTASSSLNKSTTEWVYDKLQGILKMFEVTVASSSKHDVLKLRWKGLKFSFDN